MDASSLSAEEQRCRCTRLLQSRSVMVGIKLLTLTGLSERFSRPTGTDWLRGLLDRRMENLEARRSIMDWEFGEDLTKEENS